MTCDEDVGSEKNAHSSKTQFSDLTEYKYFGNNVHQKVNTCQLWIQLFTPIFKFLSETYKTDVVFYKEYEDEVCKLIPVVLTSDMSSSLCTGFLYRDDKGSPTLFIVTYILFINSTIYLFPSVQFLFRIEVKFNRKLGDQFQFIKTMTNNENCQKIVT